MTDRAELQTIVIHANPVPDPVAAAERLDAYRSLLALIDERSGAMNQHTQHPQHPPTEAPTPPQSWRRPVIAFGTAFVVLIAALGIVYATGVFESAPDVANTIPTTVATTAAPSTTVEPQTSGDADPVITSWDRDESIEHRANHFIGLSRDRLLMGDHIYNVVDGELVPGEKLPAVVFDSHGAVGTNDGVWALLGNTLLTYVEEDGWVYVATVPRGRSLGHHVELRFSLEASPDGVVWVLKDTYREKLGQGCRDAFGWDGDTWTTLKCVDVGALGPDGVRWDHRGDFLFEDGSKGYALRRIEGDTVETFHAPVRPMYSMSWAPADGSWWVSAASEVQVHRFYQGTWSQPLGTDGQFRFGGAFIGPDGALWGIIETGPGRVDLVAFHGEEPTTILADAELGWEVSVAPDGTIWTSISDPDVEPTETKIRRIVIPET